MIHAARHIQAQAFARFPPVWFCDFSRVLTPIVAVSVDMLRGTHVPADNQDAKAVLAKCAPSSVRTAFAHATASTSLAALDAALAHVPPIFGFHFADLVDHIAAEDIALDRAERAANTGKLALATEQLATASSTAGSVTTALHLDQHHVVNVENANG